MRFILLILIFTSCQGNSELNTLKKENQQLQKKVDSLKNELHKCDMLMESYEGMPLNI